MVVYRKLRTPSGHDCEVREVLVPGARGRRWHVKIAGRSFFLWADRHLPAAASEERIWQGVLNGVDDELAQDRTMMTNDYEAPLLPQNFE